MILRNGKKYVFETNQGLELENNKCYICCLEYQTGDIITSCKDNSLKSHTFHKECFLEYINIRYQMKYNMKADTNRLINFVVECPYCLTYIIYKNIKQYKY